MSILYSSAGEWSWDGRVLPFYTTLASIVVIIVQMNLKRKALCNGGIETRYWLPKPQELVRKVIQTSCGIASVAQVLLGALLFAKCGDSIHIVFLVSVVCEI
jgi:hypothetical protein